MGLSANTAMALTISDTHNYAYLANSDAHSLQNMGREFTVYDLPPDQILHNGAGPYKTAARGLWQHMAWNLC